MHSRSRITFRVLLGASLLAAAGVGVAGAGLGISQAAGATATGTVATTITSPGAVVATYDFEDGTTQGWGNSPGVTLSNTTEAAQSGTHALKVTGFTQGSTVSVSVPTGVLALYHSYQVSAWIQLAPGQPAAYMQFGPSSYSVTSGSTTNVIAAAGAWSHNTAGFIPGVLYWDSTTTAGSMTGGTLPNPAQLQYTYGPVGCALPGPGFATSFYIDSVVVTLSAAGTATVAPSVTPSTAAASCLPPTTTTKSPVPPTTTTTTTTPPVTTTTTTAPKPTCSVAYRITASWPGGYQADVKINNLGPVVANWKLAWNFAGGQTISSLWMGSYAQTGAAVTVSAPAWATSLAAGGSASFGFIGASSGTPAVPTAFALNGAPCAAA